MLMKITMYKLQLTDVGSYHSQDAQKILTLTSAPMPSACEGPQALSTLCEGVRDSERHLCGWLGRAQAAEPVDEVPATRAVPTAV